jgi:cation transport ATPase
MPMIEKKFKYQPPKNTDERIEAIYDELSSTSNNNPNKSIETLKDHLVALLAHSKHVEWKRERKSDDDNLSTRFSLLFLAVLSILLLWLSWSNSQDWEWLTSHNFALGLWGVAFALIFVGVSIERSSFFEHLWKYGFTKIVTSVSFSGLVIFSTGKASSLINSIFGVDSSAFPFTRVFTTGLLVFQYVSPVMFIVVLFALAHALQLISYIKLSISSGSRYESPPWDAIAFLLLAIVVLLFSWKWINRDFSESKYSAKIYRLAHLLDFNSKHLCTNIKEGISVVFVGSDHSKVLVDLNSVQTHDIKSFVEGDQSNEFSAQTRFYYLPCQAGTRSQ